jgi:hypothetical protein
MTAGQSEAGAGRTTLPAAARLADALVLLLVVAGVVVELTGGFTAHPWGIRLSVTSMPRILAWAAIVLVLRHARVRRPSLWQRLGPGRIFRDAREPLAPPVPASSWKVHALVIAGFIALACVMMFEQIVNLRTVTDLGDPLFSLWRLDWVSYQLRTDPRHLFEANIFHPEPRTLAYSDAMLVPSLIAAPWLWLGADVAVVHSLLLLAASAFSGVTMFWLVRALGRGNEAAVVAGVVFAFYPLRWPFHAHLELETTVWMPLAMLGLHRMMASGRVRDGLAMGLAVTLQALSSFYFGLFLSLNLFVVAVVITFATRGRIRPAARPVIAGALLAAVIVGPATIPYFQNRSTVGERDLGAAAQFSSKPRDYVSAHWRSRLYGKVLTGDGRLELFPGIVPSVLAGAGLWLPLTPGALAYGAATGVSADASLGVHGSVYPTLFKLVFPFRGLRAPDRFSVLVGFGIAVLAGYGTERILRRVRRPRTRMLMAAGLVAAMMFESWPILNLTEVWKHPPPIYDSLPSDRNTVLVDLPFPNRDGSTRGEYSFLYFATFHHRRLVNGGSGFYPSWYDPLADRMRKFPTDETMAELKQHGAQYLVVHGYFYEPDDYKRVSEALDSRSDVKRIAFNRWNGAPCLLYQILR